MIISNFHLFAFWLPWKRCFFFFNVYWLTVPLTAGERNLSDTSKPKKSSWCYHHFKVKGQINHIRWGKTCVYVYVSLLLALKLIWAIARGRRNDEIIRMWVHNKGFPVPKCWVSYLPQHRTPSTRHPLALCHMQLTGLLSFADEGHLMIMT